LRSAKKTQNRAKTFWVTKKLTSAELVHESIEAKKRHTTSPAGRIAASYRGLVERLVEGRNIFLTTNLQTNDAYF